MPAWKKRRGTAEKRDFTEKSRKRTVKMYKN
jgi:hypothetical protein